MNKELFEEILKKTNFIVKVSREDNILTIDYAGKKVEIYELDLENYTIVADDEPIFLPSFAFRLYILLNIYFNCKKLNLPFNIVRYEEGSLVQLIPLEMDEEESSIEVFIHDTAISILEGSSPHEFDEELQEMGVLHTFNLMKGLLV